LNIERKNFHRNDLQNLCQIEFKKILLIWKLNKAIQKIKSTKFNETFIEVNLQKIFENFKKNLSNDNWII
jgi:hypothetical protein